MAKLQDRLNALESEKASLKEQLEEEREQKEKEKARALHMIEVHCEEVTLFQAKIQQEQLKHRQDLEAERAVGEGLEKRIAELQGLNSNLYRELDDAKKEMECVQNSQAARQQLATVNAIKDAFEAQMQLLRRENEGLTAHVGSLEQQLRLKLLAPPFTIYNANEVNLLNN